MKSIQTRLLFLFLGSNGSSLACRHIVNLGANTTMALTTCDLEVPILTKPVTPGVLDQPVILTKILISSVTDDSHGIVVFVSEITKNIFNPYCTVYKKFAS
jgi:hypothetical protein